MRGRARWWRASLPRRLLLPLLLFIAAAAPPLRPAAAADRPKCLRGSRFLKQLNICGCKPGAGSWVRPGAAANPGKFNTSAPSPECDGAKPWEGDKAACRCRRCPKGTTSNGGAVRDAGCYKKTAGSPDPACTSGAKGLQGGSGGGGGGGRGGSAGAAPTAAGYWSLTTSAPSQSWRDACTGNSKCVEDATGNYPSEAACAANLPQAPPLPAPCPYCASFTDGDLIANVDAWAKLDWPALAPKFGWEPSWPAAYINAVQMAKIWMVATAKYGSTAAIASEPAKSVGGPASCVASLTTAMQEGGNQAGAAATYPYKNANPFGIYDPNWNLPTLCPEADGYCRSGGPWQVSSAWIPGPWRCAACGAAGCDKLKNPLCAARISFEYARLIVNPAPGDGDNSCSTTFKSGGKECTAAQFRAQATPSPQGCSNGPFCIASAGWTAPPCLYIYRQAEAKDALPNCRLAIKACELARAQLIKAYEALGSPTADQSAALALLKSTTTEDAAIEAICPQNPLDIPQTSCPA